MAIQAPGFPGVPGTGDHLAAALGEFEPQRASNWVLTIDGIRSSEVIELTLDAFQAPRIAVDNLQIGYLNERRYVAGMAQYEIAPLRVKDMVDRDVASVVWGWFTQVYNPLTHKVGLARNYKKTATLALFSPESSFVRYWTYFGMYPQQVQFGNLEMTRSDMVTIDISLRYDRCVYTGNAKRDGIALASRALDFASNLGLIPEVPQVF